MAVHLNVGAEDGKLKNVDIFLREPLYFDLVARVKKVLDSYAGNAVGDAEVFEVQESALVLDLPVHLAPVLLRGNQRQRKAASRMDDCGTIVVMSWNLAQLCSRSVRGLVSKVLTNRLLESVKACEKNCIIALNRQLLLE